MQVTSVSEVAASHEEPLGGFQEVVSAYSPSQSTQDEPVPDAACRGWVDPPDQERIDALFVLAGLGLGIQRTDLVTTPVWLDLSEVEALDALGDPHNGLTHVEIIMKDQTVLGAGWNDAFIDAVLLALTAESTSTAPDQVLTDHDSADLADADLADAEPTVTEPAVTAPAVTEPVLQEAAPVVRDRSRKAEAAETAEAAVLSSAAEQMAAVSVAENLQVADVPASIPVDATDPSTTAIHAVDPSAESSVVGLTFEQGADADVEESHSAGLELEDVVYIGGYPGQTKKRKNCTAVLTRSGIELSGPSDLRFRMSWDSVTSIEPQNSDEARFRMNTKIHRDSSALVIECDQGITILLEARDCSTIPLRSAITQLLSDLPVQVV